METTILDFGTLDKEYFKATRQPKLMVLDEKKYLTLDGKGNPDSFGYQAGIEAIFSTAYQLKFLHKKKGEDFKVSKLECLWWAEENRSFETTPMDHWHWKLMIRIPDFVTNAELKSSIGRISEERELQEVLGIKIGYLKEGKCVQILHVGPYDKVGDSYQKLIEFIEDSGFHSNGPYHEIYISDPNRTLPENLKTIIRQPVK